MTFRKLSKVGLCLGVIAMVAGCSTIDEKRKIDYRATKTLPPLEVPPDLSTIPETRTPGSTATYSDFVTGKNAKPTEAVSGVLPSLTDVRMQRDGQTRWLVVQQSADALWPRVREFVVSSGLAIERENAAAGVIETEWADNRAKVGSDLQEFLTKYLGVSYSTGTRDKFRLRLERGAQPGTTEVYVAHRGMVEIMIETRAGVTEGGSRWQQRPPEPDIEVETLRLLAVSLGKAPEQAKTMVAQTTTTAERAHLQKKDDQTSLTVDDSLDRAWRRVGLSLDRSGFTVEDRDRSKGIYYVRYIDPDKSDRPGFMARMFSSDTKKETDQYQIKLTAAGAGTAVSVKDKDGTPNVGGTADRILGVLYEQLK